MTDKQKENRHPSDDKPWLFKPGQSGNPKGRKPGKSLKDYAREMLSKLTDEEKLEYLRGLPKDVVWKMAEGNPHTTEESKIEAEIKLIVPQEVKNKLDAKSK